MAAAEGFMGVAAISVAVAMGGEVADTAGTAVIGGAAGTGDRIGMVADDTGTGVVRIGMVVLPIGGIIHTLMGLLAGKRVLGVRFRFLALSCAAGEARVAPAARYIEIIV